MAAESSADSVRSVSRALGLLTLFDEDHPLHSLRELLERTELPKTTVLRLIQTLGSVGTTSQAYLRVPIGVAIGVLFLGESLSPAAWIGLGCVVIGVAAMTIPARQIAGAPKAV